MKIKSYKELDVWKKAIEIVDKVYDVTKNLPDEEKYNLVSQMHRSVVSIPSNVAKGFMRHHKKEYIQFLYTALGSAAELETQLIICHRRKYINNNDFEALQESIDHESRMLRKLVNALGNYENRQPNNENRVR